VQGHAIKGTARFSSRAGWVNYRAVLTNTATVPSLRLRRGDFSAKTCSIPRTRSSAARSTITRPRKGQPFQGKVIQAGQLSPPKRAPPAQRVSPADTGFALG